MKTKYKDHVSDAFDGFWASDYKAPKKAKSREDDSFDALWGRGQYTPTPKRYIADVKPVRYSIQGLTTQQRYNLKVKNLELQKLQAKRNAVASQNMGKFVGGVIRSGSSVIKQGVRIAVPKVTERTKDTQFYQKQENKAIVNEEWKKYKASKREEEKVALRKSIRAKYYHEVPKGEKEIVLTKRPIYE